MVRKNTTIVASDENINLIRIFLDANKLEEVYIDSHRLTLLDTESDYDANIRTEYYYNAVCLSYESEFADIILTNLGLKHSGINNMLVDYLLKAGILLDNIQVSKTAIKRNIPTTEEIDHEFHTKVKPELKEELKRRFPRVPIESMIK